MKPESYELFLTTLDSILSPLLYYRFNAQLLVLREFFDKIDLMQLSSKSDALSFGLLTITLPL